jgi:DNA-binding beta-propeller fold protein YncE
MMAVTVLGQCERSAWTRLALLLAAAALGGGGLGCGDPELWTRDLSVQNGNQLPTRLAEGPDARIYVSDAQVGSVFVYSSDLSVVQELKGLDQPLAVAVGRGGAIYVGSRGRAAIEVYTPGGAKLFDIGRGQIPMPNDLAFDRDDLLYVVDSLSDRVRVYRTDGSPVRSIGGSGDADGQLDFPVAVAISYHNGPGELYVADQGHGRVQVFDLEGHFLRGYGEKVEAFSGPSANWEGKFVRIQSLAIDALGRLHAADSYLNKVQILDADTGAYIGSYGDLGTAVGELNVPLDIWITTAGEVLVANSGNARVDVVHEVPGS